MKQINKLILVVLSLSLYSCAPGYKTTRFQNFTGDYKQGVTVDMVKAQLASRPIVIMSYYDGIEKKKVPQYTCIVDSVDDNYIYCKLENATFQYHLSGDKKFEVRELKKNEIEDSEVSKVNPLDVLHIYTRLNNLHEGKVKLSLNEIFAFDTHDPGMKKGGKVAVGAGIIAGGVAIGVVIAFIVVAASFGIY